MVVHSTLLPMDKRTRSVGRRLWSLEHLCLLFSLLISRASLSPPLEGKVYSIAGLSVSPESSAEAAEPGRDVDGVDGGS